MARRPMLVALACLAAAALLGAAAVFAAGEYLSGTAHAVIGPVPPGLNAAAVLIPTENGPIAGWHVRGPAGGGTVLLLHGVRASRMEMLARARFLSSQGYGVLLIDLQGHGESGGERITFGAREAQGVRAALAFMAREQPGERIGVIGNSLGAAALVLARPGKQISALVLEAMYPTIEEAVENRLGMVLGAPGKLLSPLLLQQLPLRLGVPLSGLRPIDAVGALACPTLVIGGALDLHTTADETRRIHAAVPEPKQLWIVEGAAHVDFHGHAKTDYERRVAAFLENYLRSSPH